MVIVRSHCGINKLVYVSESISSQLCYRNPHRWTMATAGQVHHFTPEQETLIPGLAARGIFAWLGTPNVRTQEELKSAFGNAVNQVLSVALAAPGQVLEKIGRRVCTASA